MNDRGVIHAFDTGVGGAVEHGYACAHLYTLCPVSLITGLGYKVEQWGGKWDETVGVANLCNWHCIQGSTYYVSRTLTSQQRV